MFWKKWIFFDVKKPRTFFGIVRTVRWIKKTPHGFQLWLDIYPPGWMFWRSPTHERVISENGIIWIGEQSGSFNDAGYRRSHSIDMNELLERECKRMRDDLDCNMLHKRFDF